MFDVSEHIKAKSDQLNADDLISGPITARISGARKGSREQPVILTLDGGHQPWKPCKTALRILVAAWGKDAEQWAGRLVELYRDDSVRFGGSAVGGIRVAGLSHIAKPMTLSLAVSRGKKTATRVAVLEDARPTERPTASLPAVMEEHGINGPALDLWLTSKGRSVVADMPPETLAGVAVFLARESTAREEIAALVETDGVWP